MSWSEDGSDVIQRASTDSPRFFMLTEEERARLRELYPVAWRETGR
jgi:hypothetical protein